MNHDSSAEKLTSNLNRWSDALQRHIDVPASSLWLMACLAHEVEETLGEADRSPELQAWLFRVQSQVAAIAGVKSWDDAVRLLQLSSRKRPSLRAWLERGAAPPLLRDTLQERLSEDPT